ncbi:hypothetical protein [Frondihabitans sp. Leaf304]|uniref:hypothetical protein n=1 Tax=Frondihabitans sp. Leaf304 TaxID=1736329 RepID=UPI0006F291CA|nr:hypothetical protein [Frondihabitans sp. Leaf304]KQQ25761.1 hypothetical protein ASF54_15400 [Frondihabitans sp. Leaf304]
MIPALWRLGLLLALRSRVRPGAPGTLPATATRVILGVWIGALAVAALVVVACVALLVWVVVRA